MPKREKGNGSTWNENNFSYTIPNFDFDYRGMNKQVMDSLRESLGKLKDELKNISFHFDVDSLNKSLKFDLQTLASDTVHNLNFEFNFENLGEIISKSVEGALNHERSAEEWEKFGMEMDSLAKQMVKTKVDSVALTEEMKKQIDQMKKKKRN